MADGRHLENRDGAISQTRKSDMDEIWYANAESHADDDEMVRIGTESSHLSRKLTDHFKIWHA